MLVAKPFLYVVVEVQQELVVVGKAVVLNPTDLPAVFHAYQEHAAVGIQKGGNCLETSMRDDLVVLLLVDVVPERGFKFPFH